MNLFASKHEYFEKFAFEKLWGGGGEGAAKANATLDKATYYFGGVLQQIMKCTANSPKTTPPTPSLLC